MDRNSIIGFTLIAIILGLYTWYSMPTAEQRAQMERERRTQDSLAALVLQREEVKEQQVAEMQQLQMPVDTLRAAEGDSLNADSLHSVALQQRFGPFAPAAEGVPSTLEISNKDLHIGISTHGAHPVLMRLKEYVTHATQPLLLADPDSGLFEFDFFLGNLKLSTRDLHFIPEKLDDRSLRLRAPTTDPGSYLEITYRLDSAGYFLHTQADLVGMGATLDPRRLVFRWDVAGLSNEKYRDGELRKSTVYYKYFNDDREYLSENGADEKKLVGRTNWVAFKQDFFTLAMISDEGFANGSGISVVPLEAASHTKHFSAELFFDKEPADKVSIPLKFYLGPNHYGTLRRTEVPQFERIIDLGWGIFGWMNRWLVIPIFNWLDGWGWSYGIIILVLTIAIKVLLMPLTWKNYISSAKMRALKPEMDAINEKYKDGDPLKKQQATMDLYRKAGVNPASGCLPMLVQMPVLFAMFKFFPSSIELRQQAFLWADDLSTYDSIAKLPFSIPLGYGDHVSLFTILMAASTIIYTVINSKQMPSQQGMPGMKMMMYIFPVMMLFFMNSLPAGLSYYYLLANVISILQMTMFKHLFVNEEKIRAELLKNMKTPKKKSRWQQRLEEMQKQQQAARRR
jgi:YidC/Oxa1 family membrane protein insertase